jgi:hypothetical protein
MYLPAPVNHHANGLAVSAAQRSVEVPRLRGKRNGANTHCCEQQEISPPVYRYANRRESLHVDLFDQGKMTMRFGLSFTLALGLNCEEI